MTIWFATGNPHKRAELAGILSDYVIAIPSEAGITDFDPKESGNTFLENAFIKAKALYVRLKEPVIADDSGLCVDALNGMPGIYSARYGSERGGKLSDQERNRLLLKELGNNPHRKARFTCAMVLLFREDRFVIVQETLEGEIIREERGTGGFGYDPILYIPEQGRTVAELSQEEKNRMSHRGKAGRRIKALLAGMDLEQAAR
jgi:XTP/dITP diphosphohydrolase